MPGYQKNKKARILLILNPFFKKKKIQHFFQKIKHPLCKSPTKATDATEAFGPEGVRVKACAVTRRPEQKTIWGQPITAR